MVMYGIWVFDTDERYRQRCGLKDDTAIWDSRYPAEMCDGAWKRLMREG